jgi:hypothetical protein
MPFCSVAVVNGAFVFPPIDEQPFPRRHYCGMCQDCTGALILAEIALNTSDTEVEQMSYV